jgi:sec-independent protein translocase protein TatA
MSGLPNIGFPELLLILGVVLLIFGPSRLAGLGGALGQTIRDFQRALKGLDDEVGSSVDHVPDTSEKQSSPEETGERKAN